MGSASSQISSTSREGTVVTSSSLLSSPPTSFTLFHKLPAELRLQIWHFGIQRPRIVEIQATGRPGDSFQSPTPNSALLFVNRESRCEALKVYKPMFGTKNKKGERDTRQRQIIYINPALDTPYFTAQPQVSDHTGLTTMRRMSIIDNALRKYKKDAFPGKFESLKRVALSLVKNGDWGLAHLMYFLVVPLFDKADDILFVDNSYELESQEGKPKYERELSFTDHDHTNGLQSCAAHNIKVFRARLRAAFERRFEDSVTKARLDPTGDLRANMAGAGPKIEIRKVIWVEATTASTQA